MTSVYDQFNRQAMSTEEIAGKKFVTERGIEIKQLYSDHATKSEKPGEFPFTRGVQALSLIHI